MLRIEQLLYLEQEQKFLSEILHKNKVFAKIHFGKNETIKFEKYSNEYNVFFTWNFKLQQKENLFYLISDIHYQYLDTLSGFIEGEFQKKEPFIEPKLISTKQVDDILKAWCRNNDIYMGKIIEGCYDKFVETISDWLLNSNLHLLNNYKEYSVDIEKEKIL